MLHHPRPVITVVNESDVPASARPVAPNGFMQIARKTLGREVGNRLVLRRRESFSVFALNRECGFYDLLIIFLVCVRGVIIEYLYAHGCLCECRCFLHE